MANLITQITPWGGNTNYAVRASAVQYGTCATGASTGTKAVTCSSFTSNYLTEGSIIAVKFTYANTAAVANLQLNVNSTGAKPIKCITNGTLENLPSTSALKSGPIYLFYYDGTNWVVLLNSNDVPTYTSSSNTVTFGATTTIGSLNGTEMTITMTSLPNASTTTAGIVQIGTSSTNAAAGNHAHGNITSSGMIPVSTGTCTIGTDNRLVFVDDSGYIHSSRLTFNTTSTDYAKYALTQYGTWEEFGTGSGSGAFFIHVDFSSEDLDKTGTEIDQAYDDGANLIVTYGNYKVNLRLHRMIQGTNQRSYYFTGIGEDGLLAYILIRTDSTGGAAFIDFGYYGLAPSEHNHGYINRYGVLILSEVINNTTYSYTATLETGDRILIADASDDNLIKGTNLSFNTTSENYALSRAGSWVGYVKSGQGSTNGNKALYTDNVGTVTVGTLPVNVGGTGLTTVTSGSVLIGNGTSSLTTRAITNNTSATTATTNSNLITGSTLYYATANINNARQTSNVGIYAPTGGGTAGQILTASGTTSAPIWTNTGSITVGAAVKDGDGNTIASTFLKLSGGTMTGTVTMLGSQYNDGYDGALNMNNSDIYGLNSIYTADDAGNSKEGIHFYRSSTTVDTIWAHSGVFYFTPNRTLGSEGTSYKIYHAGNITSGTAAPSGGSNGDIYIQYTS